MFELAAPPLLITKLLPDPFKPTVTPIGLDKVEPAPVTVMLLLEAPAL